MGIEIDENTLIPGLAVASSRAKPLASICFSASYIAYPENFIGISVLLP